MVKNDPKKFDIIYGRSPMHGSSLSEGQMLRKVKVRGLAIIKLCFANPYGPGGSKDLVTG